MRNSSRLLLVVPALLTAAHLVPAFAQDAPVAAPPAQRVALKVNLEKGARFRHLSKTHVDQTIEMGGPPMSTVFDITNTFEQEVLGANEAGGTDVRVKYGRIFGSIESAMGRPYAFARSLCRGSHYRRRAWTTPY